MADGMTVKLSGASKLARRLAALERNAGRTILSRATAAGAEVIRQEAVRLAPRSARKGVHAADHIKRRRVKASRSRAEFAIGYDKKKAWYLRFLELGTKFISAQPHLRPALDTKKNEATREVGRELKRGIDAARKKA